MVKAVKYDADALLSLSDIESIQEHPTIYAGEMNNFAVWLCVKEIIDNARDEAADGHANLVYIERLSEFEFVIYDNGRGIPVDTHPKLKMSALQVVFCKLHAGANMKQGGAYKKTLGVHGVGAAVTNAFSSTLHAASYRNGKWNWFQGKKGIPVGKVSTGPAPEPLMSNRFKLQKRGTYVTFEINKDVFEPGSTVESDTIIDYLAIMSDFYPGITFVYNDKEGEEVFVNKMSIEARIAQEHGVTPKQVLCVKDENVNIAICFANAPDKSVSKHTYVCGSPTPELGTHWTGFTKAVERAALPFIKKGKSVYAEDIAEALAGVINVELHKPRFKGQTKQKLVSVEATKLVADAITGPLCIFFTKNKGKVIEIVKRAEDLFALRQKQSQEMNLANAVKNTRGKSNLPAKLTQSFNCKPEDRELYIVEGESAGGTCKKSRFEKYQEILPLTGKILNVIKSDVKAADNGPVQDLLRTIGYVKHAGSSQADMSKARVQNKIIILTDADSDGGHIQILLLGFLFKYFKEAFEQDLVYIVDAPLYQYKEGGKYTFSQSLADMRKIPSFNSKNLTRMKGWGEIGPKALRELAFDPKTRKLFRVNPLASEDKEDFFALLTGNAEFRREMINYKP